MRNNFSKQGFSIRRKVRDIINRNQKQKRT